MFKQLLQAEAISVLQLDACRVGGVNENLAILLLAAKFGVPGVPARRRRRACANSSSTWRWPTTSPISGELDGRVIEFVDHLHEHFVDPVTVQSAVATWRRRCPGSVPACTPTASTGSGSPTVPNGQR